VPTIPPTGRTEGVPRPASSSSALEYLSRDGGRDRCRMARDSGAGASLSVDVFDLGFGGAIIGAAAAILAVYDLVGGYEWLEDFPREPRPPNLASRLRSFSVRIPRSLYRWARRWAVDAELSDQELAIRVFDSYVRKDPVPSKREEARRTWEGLLKVPEPLLADKFRGHSPELILEAQDLLIERHTRLGGPFASNPEPGWETMREGAARRKRPRRKMRRRRGGNPPLADTSGRLGVAGN
jgi:hypothetical protein